MIAASDTEMLADVIVTTVKAALEPLKKEIAELKAQNADQTQRIATLEGRPTAKDAGVWRAGVTYEPGDIVSHAGSGWIAKSMHYSTGTEPSHTDFRLFVKAGRDGKSR